MPDLAKFIIFYITFSQNNLELDFVKRLNITGSEPLTFPQQLQDSDAYIIYNEISPLAAYSFLNKYGQAIAVSC